MTTLIHSPVAPVVDFDHCVDDELYGLATREQRECLLADRRSWRIGLSRRLVDVDDALTRARQIRGEEREQIVADLEVESRSLAEAWFRATGERIPTTPAPSMPTAAIAERAAASEPVADTVPDEPGIAELQVSWRPGKVIVWAGGPNAAGIDEAGVRRLLAAAGAPSSGWERHGSVPVPGGASAPALATAVGDVLGWLIAVGADQADGDLGPSLAWIGRVAIWGVELAALGSVVPLLRQRKRARGSGGGDHTGSYSVRWTPALVEPSRLKAVAAAMPGAVTALDAKSDAPTVVRSILTGVVDAICRDAARRYPVPAPPPQVLTSNDVSEAYLGRLDGSVFDAPLRVGSEAVARLDRWSRSVTSAHERLVLQLDPPDSGDAWRVAVLAPGIESALVSIEEAIVNAGSERRDLEEEMKRLERLFPVLLRPGGLRRGQVILSQTEAWDLMSEIGPRLVDAGFDVRVPALSKRPATAALRLHAASEGQSVAGASQLAAVRWSAVFDDVELSAADIARLAREARPLIRSGGKWVAVDKADLRAAAQALEDRASKTSMTGAEMLRAALGLDDSPLAGGVTLAGSTWASELLSKAAEVATAPVVTPPGFVGELRSYQAEAAAWLGFLEAVGLGGCLALDMGLGKTPTMLAHLASGRDDGDRAPSLVIAPPAVVGNWASEARRFTPGLHVVVHHGANRASDTEVAAEAARADVVITTYGTAVRDVEALSQIEWRRLVLDEAQAIKNPANDTSQQLRRLNARTRVALTGTPIENGLGDLWSILDFTNPGLVGPRPQFIAALSRDGDTSKKIEAEDAMRALNGILVFRRTKAEPAIAAELPDRIDQLDHCSMTPEQVGLYQAVLDKLVTGNATEVGEEPRKGQILAAITALKQICNHPAAYQGDDRPLDARSGKLARLEEIVESVFAADEKVLVFTHFAEWGQRLARHLTARTGQRVECYHGGLARGARDRMIETFQAQSGPGALVLSLKAGGTGLNLTAASHVVLYDRWWNPAVEDQARDRAWRIGQTKTVICHRLVCPGTVDERVEEVVAGKRRIADMVMPKSSSLADLDTTQLKKALGMQPDLLITEELQAGVGRGTPGGEAVQS